MKPLSDNLTEISFHPSLPNKLEELKELENVKHDLDRSCEVIQTWLEGGDVDKHYLMYIHQTLSSLKQRIQLPMS
ncbi:hypothetical protein [Vibrio tapetis]|uniref:Uncharacterized protein n=1 Tax=Vibrio tapetis subsp. tapetis TaxID=1671868 RepID=A0A2N8ZHW0_9VIBR|nr:hypothetical protein [Vibrio tapetis]SON51503.1 protein of unknown function [Vibrio tapetis subsp. tapetis]